MIFANSVTCTKRLRPLGVVATKYINIHADK